MVVTRFGAMTIENNPYIHSAAMFYDSIQYVNWRQPLIEDGEIYCKSVPVGACFETYGTITSKSGFIDKLILLVTDRSSSISFENGMRIVLNPRFSICSI